MSELIQLLDDKIKLYDHGIISLEQYEGWLDDNTPRKEVSDE